jgi:hypothetical protein
MVWMGLHTWMIWSIVPPDDYFPARALPVIRIDELSYGCIFFDMKLGSIFDFGAALYIIEVGALLEIQNDVRLDNGAFIQ